MIVSRDCRGRGRFQLTRGSDTRLARGGVEQDAITRRSRRSSPLGKSLGEKYLEEIARVLTNPEASNNSKNGDDAAAMLDLVEKTFTEMQKNNVPIFRGSTLVAVISKCCLGMSKRRDPSLIEAYQRIRSNFETLLFKESHAFHVKERHLVHLASVFARMQEWPKVWDLLRLGAQLGQIETLDIFTVILRHAQASLSIPVCREALRECVPQILMRPFVVQKELWDIFVGCIEIVDPKAISRSKQPRNYTKVGKPVLYEWTEMYWDMEHGASAAFLD